MLDPSEDEIERPAFFRSDAGANIIPRKAKAYETDIQPDTRQGELRITRQNEGAGTTAELRTTVSFVLTGPNVPAGNR